LDNPLVAGSLVFFTTFAPDDAACSIGGDAYLYVLDYMCRPLEPEIIDSLVDRNRLREASGGMKDKKQWSAGDYGVAGGEAVFVTKIGSGAPSRPVMNSNRDSLFIQSSDAHVYRVGTALLTDSNFIYWTPGVGE
jgi:hypothetical protein